MAVLRYGLNSLNPPLQEAEERGGPFIPVRVLHTILDSDDPEWEKYGGWDSLGLIKFIPVYSELNEELNENSSEKSINVARPLYPNLKHYPLKYEITWIIQLPDPNTAGNPNFSSFYYINIVNIWNHPHHNAFPFINFDKLPENLKLDYKEIETGLVKNQSTGSKGFKLGDTFVEKSNIKPLKPFEGDIIYEGRWGQSIRFGSTVLSKNPWSTTGSNGDPILIIKNGQSKNLDKKGWVPTIEDINEDSTSIYFCEGQSIPIKVASNNLKSFGSILQTPNTFKIQIPDNPILTSSISPSQSDGNIPISSSNITNELTSSNIPFTSSIVSSSNKVYNEDEVMFHFPGEDTQEFIFNVESIDEESNDISISQEKYNFQILGNESPQTKNENGDYAIYKNGIPEYVPITFFENIRVTKPNLPFVKLLIDSARKEGINLKLNSGFRTFDEQVVLRKSNIKDKTKVNDLNIILNASSDKFFPQTGKPGFSKHQAGIAYDFNTSDKNVYKWLVVSGSKYGFIRTVPSEKWHWEYIPNTDPFKFVKKSDNSWENLV